MRDVDEDHLLQKDYYKDVEVMSSSVFKTSAGQKDYSYSDTTATDVRDASVSCNEPPC